MKVFNNYHNRINDWFKKTNKQHFVFLIAVLVLFSTVVYAYNSDKNSNNKHAKKVTPPKIKIGSVKSSISDLERLGYTSGIISGLKKIKVNVHRFQNEVPHFGKIKDQRRCNKCQKSINI